jgi:hypothetical protein
MAEPGEKRGPRVVRIPVARPLFTALSVAAFGAALLVGGGADNTPTASARPTRPALGVHTSTPSSPVDWDVTPRDLVAGDRSGPVSVDQVVAGPLQLATLAAARQPGVVDPLSPAAGRAGATSVPVILWSAYRSAVASAPTSCRLPVQLLAAIGQVESGSLAGRGLDSRHRAVPAVLGPVLNGGAFAAIHDTDEGRYDGDTIWDRAVGPMQFIPSTWQRWGRDGNGDGARDPQNVEDSAFSAAAYLCSGGRDLSTGAGLRSAILSYNHSAVYLSDVLRLMMTVSPGGGLPRSVVTRSTSPTPAVGPPSRPAVRALPRARASSTSTWARPSTRTTAAQSTTTTTSAATPPTTAISTMTSTSTSSPTTRTPSTTSSSSTSSSTSTSTTSTVAPTTPTPQACPPASTTSSTSAMPTGTSTATSTTSLPAPASTTPPTSSAMPSDTSSTTTGDQTPDPCAAMPTDTLSPRSGLAVVIRSASWPAQWTISNLTVLVLMLASVSLTFTRVPRSWSPVAFARTAGSST